ncbi:peptidoglycan DD-metalloendopeptidase family protein [Candidatus Chloroploca sp. Khr17]|uniref:peptidoglycan DD-metalloendopeptidase family protein n=1 Tax=Candidatus Chloroploca sp. Khr17 TaxID=2496869 RepID=UPI001F0F41CA|nr:peptidoglycan DD-metalloendopeptidase family protein [Candidatus Chloroploca sp. Khr17]
MPTTRLSATIELPTVPSATHIPIPTAKPEPTAVPTEQPTVTREPATATIEPTAIPTETTEPILPPTASPTIVPGTTVEGLLHVFPIKASWYEISSSHHDYPAADIACPIGSQFLSVTSGVVDFVSREDRYALGSKDPADRGGLSVAIIGDDGVRYYGSHLSEIAEGVEPGVRVEAGQLLGLIGISGNAAGTYPHLHFGISRPTTPDDWETRRGEIWPQEYLKAWARNENVAPAIP